MYVRPLNDIVPPVDIVDYVEPTMLIVGSRGLGNLKGYVRPSTSLCTLD